MAIIILYSGKIFVVKIPAPSKIISGNSTIVWPNAIFNPAVFPSLRP